MGEPSGRHCRDQGTRRGWRDLQREVVQECRETVQFEMYLEGLARLRRMSRILINEETERQSRRGMPKEVGLFPRVTKPATAPRAAEMEPAERSSCWGPTPWTAALAPCPAAALLEGGRVRGVGTPGPERPPTLRGIPPAQPGTGCHPHPQPPGGAPSRVRALGLQGGSETYPTCR